jgi:hypothetical protein
LISDRALCYDFVGRLRDPVHAPNVRSSHAHGRAAFDAEASRDDVPTGTPNGEALAAAARTQRRAAWWPLPVAVAATALVMLLLLRSGGIWLLVDGQDLHGAFLPKYIEAARALFNEGRLPLWNPWEMCGTPLFATIQGLVLYLPAPLLFALLPPYWALQALCAFNVLVLAWGTAVYLRAQGIGPLPAFLAILVIVAGVLTSYGMVGADHPNFVASIAWVPWILLAWQRATERGARPWLGLAALAVAAEWLGGYPDFPLDTAVLLAVVALVWEGTPFLRRIGLAVAAFALGTALVAVQLVPLAEAVGQSFRNVAIDYGELRRDFAVVSSGLFDLLYVHRFGIPALALAALALFRPQRSRLAWTAALAVAILAGDPPLSLLYRLPPFSGVRFAFGWSHLAALFVGLLVAAGLQDALASHRRIHRLIVVALALVVASGRIVQIAGVPELGRPVAPDYALIAQRVPILQDALAQLLGNPRLVSGRETDSGTTVRSRIPSASGYDPTMPPRRIKRLIDAVDGFPSDLVRGMSVKRNPRLAGLMGIGLVTVPRGFAPVLLQQGFTQIATLPPKDVLLYREPVPRARIVHRAIAAVDEETSFARTVDVERDLFGTAVIERAEPLPALEPPADGTESAVIRDDLPERVVVDATLSTAGLLVLTDTWYPGWRVSVDGAPAPILRADYAFRAVALTAGAHRVTFEYVPLSFQAGLVVTLLTALVVAGLLGVEWPRHWAPAA